VIVTFIEEKQTQPAMMNMDLRPLPLLVLLVKKTPGEEFGFNLHAEKGRGHFIGSIDKGGIGDRAGLVTGQRIVGVNGEFVHPSTPHKVGCANVFLFS
jgi:predicted metalloprotease with PDZ domain